MAEFRIFTVKTKKDGRVTSLDFMRATFTLFRALLSRVPWESAFKDFGVHICLSVFKIHLSEAQEQRTSPCCESSKQSRRPACLNRELLV